MRKELLKGLSEEQIKKLENCKDSEEILALAKEEGVTLNDEQLEAVSGGCGLKPRKCPECGSSDVELCDTAKLKCNKCGKRWKI